jgi:hypothetical protein
MTSTAVAKSFSKLRPDNDAVTPSESSNAGRPVSNNFARRRHWVEYLKDSNVSALWAELHRVVSSHPLVRASRTIDRLIEEGATNAYTDLTQELFVQLLLKSRFQHYLDSGMNDAEIECEISQLELTNLLTADLRKRHPEGYRLSRRISTLVQSSAGFCRFDCHDQGYRQRGLTERVYGLSHWPLTKPTRGFEDLEQRAQLVPMRQRDNRMVGRTGDAQILITNSDLEELMVLIFEAIDSPADVRTLRHLVMSRLNIMDLTVVPLGGDENDSAGAYLDPVDVCDNPEETLLRREAEHQASLSVDRFLQNLHANVRGKIKQYHRMLGVLWHCYLKPEPSTQVEVSAILGVSDSLISDYRQRIERELSALALNELELAKMFELALQRRIGTLFLLEEESSEAA